MYGLHQVLLDVTGPKKYTAWHFSISKLGLIEQHYPLSAVLAHCADWGDDDDGANGNGELIGVEHEGVTPAGSLYGPVLTGAQLEASVRLNQWIAEQGGYKLSRLPGSKTLFEHNEISDTGTQCPSHRIPWKEYTLHAQLTGQEVATAGYIINQPGLPPLNGIAAAKTEPTSAVVNGYEQHILWIKRG